MTLPTALALGKVVACHGIQGHVKVHSFMERPRDLFSFSCFTDEGLSQGPHTWRDVSPLGGAFFRACFAHVHSRTQAENMGRPTLYVSFDLLKEIQKQQKEWDDDTFYYTELCGMQVISVEGVMLGKVRAVHNFGAGHLLEVPEVASMIPFREPFVVDVQRQSGTIVVEVSLL